MGNELKEKAKKIISLLTPEQREQEIIEIENNAANHQLIEYLESIGPVAIDYEIARERFHIDHFQATGGYVSLWEKRDSGDWIILLWRINRVLGLGLS